MKYVKERKNFGKKRFEEYEAEQSAVNVLECDSPSHRKEGLKRKGRQERDLQLLGL